MELPKGLQGIIQVQLRSTYYVPGSVLGAVESDMIETSLCFGDCMPCWMRYLLGFSKPRGNVPEKLVCCRDASGQCLT